MFRQLLTTAYANGGGLIKFGGDALLLLFAGEHHASDGATAAIGMRRALADLGQIDTSAGKVRLRMSVGVHSGEFHMFLVGDRHRELIMTGPAASRAVDMEGTADAGQIVVSPETAARLPAQCCPKPRARARCSAATAHQRRGQELRARSTARAASVDLRRPRLPARSGAVGRGEPEHRRVTIGFIHYDGTDEMIAQRPLAEVAGALDGLVSAAQEACDAHGVTFLGTDVDHDGGKIILVAGAPTATGDDEARMLAALRHCRRRRSRSRSGSASTPAPCSPATSAPPTGAPTP